MQGGIQRPRRMQYLCKSSSCGWIKRLNTRTDLSHWWRCCKQMEVFGCVLCLTCGVEGRSCKQSSLLITNVITPRTFTPRLGSMNIENSGVGWSTSCVTTSGFLCPCTSYWGTRLGYPFVLTVWRDADFIYADCALMFVLYGCVHELSR